MHQASRSVSMRASTPSDVLQRAPYFAPRHHYNAAKRIPYVGCPLRSTNPFQKAVTCPQASSSTSQSASDQPDDTTTASSLSQSQNLPPSKATSEAPSLGQRIKRFFGGDKLDRKRLQALGLGAVASYGFVSNATYGTGLSISWITFVRQTGRVLLTPDELQTPTLQSQPCMHNAGKSPLMAQQWKPFLALYGGFWAAQHFIRPLRFSLALAMAPVFDRFINFVQQKTHFKRQNAFAVYLCLLGSITSICVFGSIRAFAGPMAFAMV